MQRLLYFLLCIVALCSVIGFFGKLYWFFDLFNHFRPQAVIASLLLLAPALFLKNKNSIVLAVLLVVVNAGVIVMHLRLSGGIPERPPESIKTNAVTLVSMNVLTSNRDYQTTLNLIAAEAPDILVMTEVDNAWIDALKPLHKNYPHALRHPRSDNFGMAVYAKMPFSSRILDAGEQRIPMMSLDFGDFALLAVHPLPPVSKNNAKENRTYLRKAAETALLIDKPLIIAGDLNSTLWSYTMRPLFGAHLKRVNPNGISYTWPTSIPFLALQIDHILARGITAGDFRVLPAIGSDHFPTAATLYVPVK